MAKLKMESHLYIYDTLHTVDNLSVLAERLQKEVDAHTLTFGKINSPHGRYFYLFVTDEQSKEWKVKVSVRELQSYEAQTTSVRLMMDLEGRHNREQQINQSVVIQVWSDHKEVTYTHNSPVMHFYIDLLEKISKAFPFAKNTNYSQSYENGERLRLTTAQLKEQIDVQKQNDGKEDE